MTLFFQGIDDTNLTNVGKKLTDFFQKMSSEEKKLFLTSTPKIRNLTQKDQLAFLTLFGKQPANKEYTIFIDNRDNGQKAYLIDGTGIPKISFDISGGKKGASSPE